MKNLISKLLLVGILVIPFLNVQAQKEEKEKFPARTMLHCYLQEEAGTKNKLVRLFSGDQDKRYINLLKVKGKNGRERTLKKNEFATVSLDSNNLTLIENTGPNRFENDEIRIIITNYDLYQSAAVVSVKYGPNIDCLRK